MSFSYLVNILFKLPTDNVLVQAALSFLSARGSPFVDAPILGGWDLEIHVVLAGAPWGSGTALYEES